MLKVLTMSEADKEKPAAAEKDVRAAWVAIRGHPTSEPRSLSQQWFYIIFFSRIGKTLSLKRFE